MTFAEFVAAFNSGDLGKDAAWRAYDIPAGVRREHTKAALKRLGLSYAGELAIPEACAQYGMDIEAAPTLLGAWWLFREISAGRGFRVPLRK